MRHTVDGTRYAAYGIRCGVRVVTCARMGQSLSRTVELLSFQGKVFQGQFCSPRTVVQIKDSYVCMHVTCDREGFEAPRWLVSPVGVWPCEGPPA